MAGAPLEQELHVEIPKEQGVKHADTRRIRGINRPAGESQNDLGSASRVGGLHGGE
jgi:hypothetical protein